MEKFQLSILCGAILLLTGCGGGSEDKHQAQPEPVIPTCTTTQYFENNICKDKAQQSITGLILPNTINIDQSVELAAKSSAGLIVTYTSKTENTCRLVGEFSDNTVQMYGVGVCTIEANQSGNNKILPAKTLSVSTTILPVLTGTGIKLCATGDKNNLACNTANLGDLFGLGQDAEVKAGRDMDYSLVKYSNDECIKDNVTGLLWEQKTSDGKLRDQNSKYSWFDGSIGTKVDDLTCNYNLSSCNTKSYLDELNKTKYCGYSDWRLPTRQELLNVIDFSKVQPSIHTIFTPTASGMYWTSNTTRYDSSIWTVDFTNGQSVDDLPALRTLHIRAVRADQ